MNTARAWLLFLGPLACASAAAQVAPDARPDVRIEQQNDAVGPASDQVSAPQVPGDAAARPLPQIPGPGENRDGVRQLTRERAGASAGAQVSRGAKSARASDPLSTPAQGRTGAVARVEGEDRCAPDRAGTRPPVCDRPIETRAADFARPRAPVLSAEQQLIVDQRLREAGLVDRVANGRRMDPNGLDPDTLASQEIASVVLDPQDDRSDPGAPGPGAPLTGLPDAAAALIEVILQNAGTQPPR